MCYADVFNAVSSHLTCTFNSGDSIQGDIPNNKNLVVDDISIELLPMNCEELILNTDMSLGHARFWDE
jgi:hypothetical protein